MLAKTAAWLATIPVMLGCFFASLSFGQPIPGQIVVDSTTASWLRYAGGGPHFLAGAGDPENFLYRGGLQPDGTRIGDQHLLITKLAATGANGIYFQAVRSHGGDGDATQNPFIAHDPGEGLNRAVLDQWEKWIAQLDSASIVSYFFFYDDGARIWDTGDQVSEPEKSFIEALVNRFEKFPNLVWVVAEEYEERYSAERISQLASIIRDADDHDHVIGVHTLSGFDFDEFADDPTIDQFTMQYNHKTATGLHKGVLKAWARSAGRYNINMSEAADYGTGATARIKNWSVALGGAYVMVLGMDIANTPTDDLMDLGRLVRFMESTNFHMMSPHDELAHAETQYVLALPGKSYIAYASNSRTNLGLKNLPAGEYRLIWYDPVDGTTVIQDTNIVSGGDRKFSKPPSIGSEVAVYVRRMSQ